MLFIRRINTEEFKQRLQHCHGSRFELLSEYKNNSTKVKLKCNICNNIIEKMPAKLVCAPFEGCYICSGKNHYKTKESLQKEIDEKYPDTYVIIGEYIRARTPIEVKRISCGHTYMISPDNLLRGKGCPKCTIRQSHYMDIVENFLNKNNIEYTKEKVFSDCKHIRSLPFDYYIPKLNVCIEVDGEFHYIKNTKFSNNTNSSLEAVKIRDKIKDEYCEKYNIKLIRLPYFKEREFENILKEELYVNTEITQTN